MSERYLDNIVLSQTVPCLAEPGKISVIGEPSCSLDEVLPYLAALPNTLGYNPKSLTLTFRRPRGFMTIYPKQVVITQVADVDEGFLLFQALTDAINTTWENRHMLSPVRTRIHNPTHLDIFGLLPKTNCKQCGEATCFAFALKLILQQRSVQECLQLQNEPAYAERRKALEAML